MKSTNIQKVTPGSNRGQTFAFRKRKTLFARLLPILIVIFSGGVGVHLLVNTNAYVSSAEQITSMAGGRCIDVYKALTANNSTTVISDCRGTTNQQWKIDNGGFIRSVASGRCLSLKDGATANGTSIVIYDCKGLLHQQWAIYSNGTIHSKASNRCIGLKAGATVNATPLIFNDCNDTTTQKWKVIPPSISGNKITFTYNSKDFPWTETELDQLQKWEAIYYPLIVNIYGYPAKSYTVNVLKNPNVQENGIDGTFGFCGAIGCMTLGQLDESVYVHEMIHSFRSDITLPESAWEEGMTRAAEIEAFNRTQSPHFDLRHGYYDDTHYENQNTPNVTVKDGSFFGNGTSAMVLLRYQLAGYAWAKIQIEDPTFLSRFNAALYANPTLQSNIPQLRSLVASLVPTVEGAPTAAWLKSQYILNDSPAEGCALYSRTSIMTEIIYCRDPNGTEIPQANTPVYVTSYDYKGNALSRVQLSTKSNGVVDLSESINLWPETYTGRVKLIASATVNGQALKDTRYIAVPQLDNSGIIGAITNAGTASLTFSSPGGAFQPITVQASNGAYSVPALMSVQGQIKVSYKLLNGLNFSRTFTKDASNYLLNITL